MKRAYRRTGSIGETTLAYRDALSSLWLLDAIRPWTPSRNHLDRLGQSPKHQLADPALAARLLGLDASALLRAEQGSKELSEGTILGALFEHLAALAIHTWLRDRMGQDLIDAVVIYAGEYAYRRRDNVAAVPLALLGP